MAAGAARAVGYRIRRRSLIRAAPALILLGLSGCDTALPEAPATPSPLEAPAPLPLAEVLYGGETGDALSPLGDRVRLLVWLRTLGATAAQLRALRAASLDVRAVGQRARAAQAEAGLQEAEALGGAYSALARDLAAGTPGDDALAAHAAALTAGRSSLGRDPRDLQARWVETALDAAGAYAETLLPEQRRGMVNALFLVRRELGPGAAPAAYEGLLGQSWEGSTYASLRRARSPDQDHLDLGGLWTLDAGETDLVGDVAGLRLQALLAVALTHPDLAGACEVMLGERDALDLSVGPTP